MKKLIFLPLILSQFFLACSSDDDSSEYSRVITIDAKVVNAGGGACAYLIQPLEDSEVYFLGEIPDEFKVNNLEILLTYRNKNAVFSCSGFLTAQEIEIVTIE